MSRGTGHKSVVEQAGIDVEFLLVGRVGVGRNEQQAGQGQVALAQVKDTVGYLGWGKALLDSRVPQPFQNPHHFLDYLTTTALVIGVEQDRVDQAKGIEGMHKYHLNRAKLSDRQTVQLAQLGPNEGELGGDIRPNLALVIRRPGAADPPDEAKKDQPQAERSRPV